MGVWRLGTTNQKKCTKRGRETHFAEVAVRFGLFLPECPHTWSSVMVKSHEALVYQNWVTLLLKVFLQPFSPSNPALKSALIYA